MKRSKCAKKGQNVHRKDKWFHTSFEFAVVIVVSGAKMALTKTGSISITSDLDRFGQLILRGVVLSGQDLTVFMGTLLAPSEENHHPDNEDDEGNDKESKHKPCSPLVMAAYVCVCVCVCCGEGEG